MEPVTALVASAIVGVIAKVVSSFLNSFVAKRKSHEIELVLPDGTKKTLQVHIDATPGEVEQEVRRELDQS